MPTIDHDKSEKPRQRDESPWLYPAGFVMIGLLWMGYFIYRAPDWLSLMLGLATGMMFTAWAIETTGNKYLSSPPDDRSAE